MIFSTCSSGSKSNYRSKISSIFIYINFIWYNTIWCWYMNSRWISISITSTCISNSYSINLIPNNCCSSSCLGITTTFWRRCNLNCWSTSITTTNITNSNTTNSTSIRYSSSCNTLNSRILRFYINKILKCI